MTQSPIEGFSLKSTFDNAKAEALHKTQYFEMFGHRSLYHEGWRAVCPWPGTSFVESGMQFGAPMDHNQLTELDAKGWELYNLEDDPCETKDLAAKEKARLIAMIGMWYAEAGKYNVLPIDSRGTLRFAEARPQIAPARKQVVFYPGTQVVPSSALPSVVNVPHAVAVHANVPKGGAEGVLFCMGGNDGGFVFYIKGGKLTYGYNYVADKRFKIESKDAKLPEGDHVFSFEFTPTGKPDVGKGKGVPAKITLHVDGKQVGTGDLPVTIPLSLGIASGVSVGMDTGSPVMLGEDYKPPFAFTGTIKKAMLDVSGEATEDLEAKVKVYMARQ